MPFSLKNIVTAIHSLSKSQRTCLLHGDLKSANPVVRQVNGPAYKWNIRKTEVPWPIYTPHHSGYFILVGFDHIEKLAFGMLFTEPFSVDDAWFGMMAARMGLRLHMIDEILTIGKNLSTHAKFPKLG